MIYKPHTKNEFYVKPIRGGFYAVYDGYDKSVASIEISAKNANKTCQELNRCRNLRYNF